MKIYWVGTEMDAIGGSAMTTTEEGYYDDAYSDSALLVSDAVGVTVTLPNKTEPIPRNEGTWATWSIQMVFRAQVISSHAPESYCWQGIKAYDEYGEVIAWVYSDNAIDDPLNLVIYIKTSSASAAESIGFVNIRESPILVLHAYENDEGGVSLLFTDFSNINYIVSCPGQLIPLKSASVHGGNSKVTEGEASQSWYAGVSEFLIYDYPSGYLRVKTLRPTADGVYQDWNGNYNDIDNLSVNNNIGIGANTANSVETFTQGITFEENNIVAVCIGSAIAHDNSDGIRGVIYFNGELYSKSFSNPLTQTITSNVAIYPTNPATGTDWTADDVNALEFGVERFA